MQDTQKIEEIEKKQMMPLKSERDYEPIWEILTDIEQHLGVVVLGEAGSGKSYAGFSLVKETIKNPNYTTIIFTSSTIWRKKMSNILCVKVGTPLFNPIMETENLNTPIGYSKEVDKKYSYVNSAWLNSLLDSKKNLLFEIKYQNGRKIKHFITQVLTYIYNQQEANLENEDYKHHYLITIEEIQNVFGSHSMSSDDSLELLTIFTQSRSDANMHYLAIGQRLNDINTKIVERLRLVIGLTLGENALKKVKSQLPKKIRYRVSQLPPRHFIYLNGTTNPEIEIPIYKKYGAVTCINPNTYQP